MNDDEKDAELRMQKNWSKIPTQAEIDKNVLAIFSKYCTGQAAQDTFI